ncbi:sulfotransferase family 2 domain-containing protein [Tropicimonas sediminicola]|uniref:Sulfotransferase family protein n=1 Tax=Tropicimonas sediminicola TaxID=1031541 RepID=A0A239GSS6_9RHOB|nr:sulfotransferase family 2 domain-containing protein [Tropicimonas sediminicola]SNS72011.1 hypothetical protein SAMN05421757_10384 [Tropicimonas sediminicola]
MQIAVRNRFVFVANSKAASTSLEKALSPHAEIQRSGRPSRKHIHMSKLLEVYDFLFEQPGYGPETFFKFAVMREPMEWIASWYRYRSGNDVGSAIDGKMTFADFWERNDWNITRKDGTRNLQSHFMCDDAGKPLVDFIIRYDRLATEFPEICKGLRLKVELPELNVSRIGRGDSVIPEELRTEVSDHFAEDYALYDRIDEINRRGREVLAETRVHARRRRA